MSTARKQKAIPRKQSPPSTIPDCPFCGLRIAAEDVDFGRRAVLAPDGKWRHRVCHFARTEKFKATEKLFQLQDDPKTDPETSLADLIGDLALFAKIKEINFERALDRGRRFAEEES